ncbi:MAG: 2-C-methyl-D-erythritol 4-phosphate cytidylyltransferase [Bacillota bacterium]|nr:2-C-methyl-D-erythritol 4-phosphate cytidylyltransferase [Bacillota bacterium]
MIFGAILAGGSGTRMHISSLPKQFLPIGEKPIIIHTLEKMLVCHRFDAIFIGVHSSWLSLMNDLLEKHEINTDKVRVVSGGDNRNDTIFNIITEIEKEFGASDEHIIVTHDAVRPFITLRILEQNIDAALKNGACDTVIPATDTIVVSDNGKVITDIPNRTFMYQGQTPQSFKINLLKELFERLSEDEKQTLTDACKICVLNNYPVALVNGDLSNIKITTVNDYTIAQVIAGAEPFGGISGD